MALSAMSCKSAIVIQMKSPPLPSPLKWGGYSYSWLQVQASKEQAGFDTRSCDQTPAKKQRYTNSCFGMQIRAADFLPSHTQILLQLFQLCAVIQSDLQAAQEKAISILGWETSLKEGSGTSNPRHCTVLLSPGSDIKPRPWLHVVVKYPVAVVIRTNGINPVLWPNLNVNFSPPGSPWRFIWKEFLCLKLSHF